MDQNNSGGNPPPNQPPGPGGQKGGDSGAFSQEIRHQPLSARVPEKVSRGVMSTGVLVLDSPHEFVLDFMQALARPFHVVARVVLTPTVMDQFAHAARDNLSKFEKRFGTPTPLPKPQTDRRPTLQEIYDDFKLPDEMMSGVYANAVMVGHSASEFFFDFITNFYPTSAVSARIHISAQQMPRLVEAVNMALGRYQQRMQAARQQHMQQQPPIQHPSLESPPPAPNPPPPEPDRPPRPPEGQP